MLHYQYAYTKEVNMSADKIELVDELKRSRDATFEHLNNLEQIQNEKIQLIDELLEWLELTCNTLKH